MPIKNNYLTYTNWNASKFILNKFGEENNGYGGNIIGILVVLIGALCFGSMVNYVKIIFSIFSDHGSCQLKIPLIFTGIENFLILEIVRKRITKKVSSLDILISFSTF